MSICVNKSAELATDYYFLFAGANEENKEAIKQDVCEEIKNLNILFLG